MLYAKCALNVLKQKYVLSNTVRRRAVDVDIQGSQSSLQLVFTNLNKI